MLANKWEWFFPGAFVCVDMLLEWYLNSPHCAFPVCPLLTEWLAYYSVELVWGSILAQWHCFWCFCSPPMCASMLAKDGLVLMMSPFNFCHYGDLKLQPIYHPGEGLLPSALLEFLDALWFLLASPIPTWESNRCWRSIMFLRAALFWVNYAFGCWWSTPFLFLCIGVSFPRKRVTRVRLEFTILLVPGITHCKLQQSMPYLWILARALCVCICFGLPMSVLCSSYATGWLTAADILVCAVVMAMWAWLSAARLCPSLVLFALWECVRSEHRIRLMIG